MRSQRILAINSISIAITGTAFCLALLLRFDFDFQTAFARKNDILVLSLLLFSRQLCRIYWNLSSISWRYVAAPDLQRILKAHICSSLIFIGLLYSLSVTGFPRSVVVIEFLISLLLTCGAKFSCRIWTEWKHKQTNRAALNNCTKLIIIGAGYSGHLLVKTILSQLRSKFNPVGCLDDSDKLQGGAVHGVPILGKISDLENILLSNSDINNVVVAIPSISNSYYSQIEHICSKHSVLIRRVRQVEDLACLDTATDSGKFTIESLLDKPVSFEYETEIATKIAGQIILITGAGGSIGSEICRQTLSLGASKIICLDNCEYNLYKLGLELSHDFSNERFELLIGSVLDNERVNQIFSTYRPTFVFHAAAYKHVPLMEFNPKEAFKNNVLGTQNIIRLSKKAKIQRVVLISTDKAVDPNNVMGATKRLAELIGLEFANNLENSKTQVAVVRFGNVINSAGSVIPLFKEQINRGGPITVTHPEVERFFMSIPQAVRLVITAGLLADKGDTYVLDMGKKLKVLDVAKRMLELYGREDLKIVFTGLRPGEKMTEELTGEGEVLKKTELNGVYELISSPQIRNSNWSNTIEDLKAAMDQNDDNSFKQILIEKANPENSLKVLKLNVA